MAVRSATSLTMHLPYFLLIAATCYNWALQVVPVATTRSVPVLLESAPPTTTPTRLPLSARFRNDRMPSTIAMAGNESTLKANMFPEDFAYVVTMGLGTPPTQLSWVVDTGSEFAWTQCQPCYSCYKQEDPIFRPASSSTYSAVRCDSDACGTLGVSKADCRPGNWRCQFAVYYMDGSETTGDFAKDVLSLDGVTLSESYPVGCGHRNTGLFDVTDGLMGFNWGPLAFPAQANIPSFAYCLSSPLNTSSDFGAGYLTFPVNSSDAGNCTGLASNSMKSYLVELQSIAVNGEKYDYPLSILVDSGTVITRLPSALYNHLRRDFVSAMNISPIVDFDHSVFDTCFNVSDIRTNDDGLVLPSVSFTFDDGLNFTLSKDSLLWGPSKDFGDDSVYCLAFTATDDGVAILGNYQQQKFQFTYDIANSKLCISTEHTRC